MKRGFSSIILISLLFLLVGILYFDDGSFDEIFGRDLKELDKKVEVLEAQQPQPPPEYNDPEGSNDPPFAPTYFLPENGATDVEIRDGHPDGWVWLDWWRANDPNHDSVTYEVSLFNKENKKIFSISGISSPGVAVPALTYSTTYKWSVNVIDSFGSVTSGPVWTFVTQGVPPPPPPTTASKGDWK